MSLVLALIAAAFYSVSSAMLSRTIKSGVQLPPNFSPSQVSRSEHTQALEHRLQIRRLTLLFASMAVVVHGWVVINQTGLPYGLSLPLSTSVSATFLTVVLLHIVLCLKQPADYLGLGVYPLAALSVLISQASGGDSPIVSSAVQLHVLLSLVAYAVLALAVAQAMLVAIQRHFLASHRPGGFMRALPPLDTTERLLFTLLSMGFVLLSLALLSGFFFLENMFAQRLVHKTILSCIGWAVIGGLLFGRWRFGWRGKKALHWTLGGFGILLLAYFGSKVVIEIFLT